MKTSSKFQVLDDVILSICHFSRLSFRSPLVTTHPLSLKIQTSYTRCHAATLSYRQRKHHPPLSNSEWRYTERFLVFLCFPSSRLAHWYSQIHLRLPSNPTPDLTPLWTVQPLLGALHHPPPSSYSQDHLTEPYHQLSNQRGKHSSISPPPNRNPNFT